MDSNVRSLLNRDLESIEKLDHSWFFRFDADVTIATESLWRLIHNGRIAVTSDDHGHAFGLPAPVDAAQRVHAAVSGRHVSSASIDTATGDLTVEFDSGTRLQLLQTTCGYEAWHLTASDGSESLCMGGGEIYFPVHYVTKGPKNGGSAQT